MAVLTSFDDDLNSLDQTVKSKAQDVEQASLHLKDLEHKVQSLTRDSKTSLKRLEELVNEFDWIESEKTSVAFPCNIIDGLSKLRRFGEEGSIYDFNKVDMKSARVKREELRHQQQNAKKKINTKVINMIEGYAHYLSHIHDDLTTSATALKRRRWH